MTLTERILQTRAPGATLLIRAMVGAVFVSEGILKFLEPAALGVGRFAKIGIPFPEVMGPFVGGVELASGLLVLAGLMTRLAALTLLIDMFVAIVSTKIPILLGHDFWGFSLKTLPSYGFFSMAHEARTDFAMTLGSVFLLLVGSGPWAVDRHLLRRIEL